MDAVGKMFKNNKVKIMGGDVAAGEWEYSMGTLWGAFEQIDLHQIKSIQPQTEESVNNPCRSRSESCGHARSAIAEARSGTAGP